MHPCGCRIFPKFVHIMPIKTDSLTCVQSANLQIIRRLGLLLLEFGFHRTSNIQDLHDNLEPNTQFSILYNYDLNAISTI